MYIVKMDNIKKFRRFAFHFLLLLYVFRLYISTVEEVDEDDGWMAKVAMAVVGGMSGWERFQIFGGKHLPLKLD